ncbi:MAG: DUF6067 family protein [Victivallales bacterium]|jgi:hypothetical protein|nr:DUF6067 family protein [Victivallales bacterium]
MKKVLCGILLSLNLSAEILYAQAVPYQLPRISSPAIDGKFSTEEWEFAAKKYGFGIHASTKDLGLRQGYTLMGYDNDYLYLAIVTELPPTEIPFLSSCRFRDGSLIMDDGIEIWCGKDAKTQYQYIVNDRGVVFDVAHKSTGNDLNWNSKWKFASGKTDGNWICELAIPLSDLGIAGKPDGKEISFFVARNWKNPAMQSPFAGMGWKYATYLLSPENPTVRIDSIGKLEEQLFSLEGTIKNNTSASRNYLLELKFTHSDMPSWSQKQELAVAPGQKGQFKFYADAIHIHQNASHKAELTILCEGKPVFSENYQWSLPRNMSQKWEHVRRQVSQLHFAYYPYLDKLIFHLDGVEKVDKIEAEISLSGKTVAQKSFDCSGDKFNGNMDTGALKEGVYNLSVVLFSKGSKVKTLNKTFERIVFPWEHNQLGITREVIPPFEKITYPGGREIKMSLKTIGFTPEGLYSSLKLSGRELLSGKAEYTYADDIGTAKLRQGEGEFIEKSDDRAVYCGKGSARDFAVETRSITEYDGCTRFELTLAPESGKQPVIRSFYLDIPLNSDQIRLLHVIGSGMIRSNPATKVPSGEGEVWRSSDISVGEAYGNMQIYLWLGEMERGISWFADNDRNFSVDDKQPVQQLIRQNGVLTLRVNFINKPLTLKEKRTIVFGMQPSPTRPMPEFWRSRKFVPPMHGGSNGYWGINAAFAGKYPVGYDWSFAEKLLEARQTGRADRGFVDDFFKKHYAKKQLPADLAKHYTNHFHAGNWNMAETGKRESSSGNKEAQVIYFEEHCQDQTTPEWRVFQDEWDTQLFSPRTWLPDILTRNALVGTGIKIVPSRSYCDFAAYYLKKWAEYGLGTYYDNTFPRPSRDINTTAAYVRENGEIQPSSCIWEMREYHKRTWLLTRLLNRESQYPIMKSVHMTNGMILPIVAWTDINLDLEWSLQNGERPFPPELIEIESTGRQNGAWPHVLYTLSPMKLCFNGYNNPIKDGNMPTEWAMRVIYDVLINNHTKSDPRVVTLDQALISAGYASLQARVHKYWEQDYPVKCSNDKIKSTLVINGKKGFFVAASWSDQPEKAAFTFDPKYKIANVKGIHPSEIQLVHDNTLNLEFVAYDYAVVEIELDK